jgi:hypothetical protein
MLCELCGAEQAAVAHAETAKRRATMRLGYLTIVAAICSALSSVAARAETLAELVKKEEGVEFGVCVLMPRPNVAGKQVYVVVPARFETPGLWVTRSLLFVGVDDAGNVQGVAEAKTLHDVAPREVISIACNKNRVTIRMTDRMKPKTLSYLWSGKELRRR